MNVEDTSSERPVEPAETVSSCGDDTGPNSGEKPVNEKPVNDGGGGSGEPYTDP